MSDVLATDLKLTELLFLFPNFFYLFRMKMGYLHDFYVSILAFSHPRSSSPMLILMCLVIVPN